MSTQRSRGFTLIELLTVIAIISILFGMVAVGLGRARERANIADVESDFKALQTALATYYATRGSYPAAYGYLIQKLPAGTSRNAVLDEKLFMLTPYLSILGEYGNDGIYDRFSDGYDTDGDSALRSDVLGRMEFLPILKKDETGAFIVPKELYNPATSTPGAPGDLITGEHSQVERPYVYIPVNLDQFRAAKRYFDDVDAMASTWRPNVDPDPGAKLQGHKDAYDLTFPPPRYDAYVLISVGPREDAGGVASPGYVVTSSGDVIDVEARILADLRTRYAGSEYAHINNGDDYIYHILGLRAFYLATRDLNENKQPDYDFRARTRGGGEDADPATYHPARTPKNPPLLGSLSRLPNEYEADRDEDRPKDAGGNAVIGSKGPGPLLFSEGYSQ